jgi:fumarate reductase (CoM/CoB) subunit A
VPATYMNEEVYCDVLIIGAGAAGSCAAAAALERDASVCVAVKGFYAQIGMRGAGASACGNTEHGLPRLPDIPGINYNPEQMVENAMKAGLGMADRRLVNILADKGAETRKDLEAWGCTFTALGAAGLGYPFIRAVEKKIRSSAVIMEHTMIYDLLISEGECIGAMGFSGKGEVITVRAKSVIIAAGGNARLYSHNVHPSCCTADGYAMALRAGAHLMNMEFMQIFTATVSPTRNLVHTWKSEQLELLYNRDGHCFLEDYLPTGISAAACREENIRHAPFSTRDAASRYLAVGIVKEILSGRGTDNGGVFLDLSKTAHLIKPAVRDFMRYKGIPPEDQPLEIAMAHQCSNGGMVVDTRSMSAIPGLFGAGEAVTGMHGADRIGANMLAQCAVFGRTAGIEAAEFARGSKSHIQLKKNVGLMELPIIKKRQKGTYAGKVGEYRRKLEETAWQYGLVVRDESGLKKWLGFLNSAEESLFILGKDASPEEVIAALELRNLVLVGKAVCLSALERRESRGPHYREDFPELDSQRSAAALISLDGKGNPMVEPYVVDPEWSDEDAQSLGNMRWG